MKKIKVTIMCAGMEEFPRCSDLLESCPEISILAQPGSLYEAGAWRALGRSDILILDEAVVQQDGFEAIRDLHAGDLSIRSLLILDNYNKNNIMSALSLGIVGVIVRDSLLYELYKALTAIFTGEAWVPRGLVEPLRDELIYMDRKTGSTGQSMANPGRDKMN